MTGNSKRRIPATHVALYRGPSAGTGDDGSKPPRGGTLAEWRAKQLREVTLPSGLVVRLRNVTMTDLMLTGKLPEPILDMAEEANRNGQEAMDLKAVAKNAGQFAEMLDLITKLSLVEPPLALDGKPDEEHLTLAEISGDDKMAIFNLINGGTAELRPFREGEDEPVETARDGGGVRGAAELDHGAAGSEAGVPVR